MTLEHKPEHHIKSAHEESAVAHITFADESGMLQFLADNRKAIRSVHEHWNVDWEPMLTFVAR